MEVKVTVREEAVSDNVGVGLRVDVRDHDGVQVSVWEGVMVRVNVRVPVSVDSV